MTIPGPQNAYLQSFGTGTIFPTVIINRAPTTNDFNGPSGQLFQVTQRWIDSSNDYEEWMLVGFVSSNGYVQANWQSLTLAGTDIGTINGDTGSITGNTVTIFTNNASLGSGASVLFTNSGTVSTLSVTDSNSNTLIGNGAGNLTFTSSTANTGVGQNVLSSLTTAALRNSAFGASSLKSLTSGDQNTSIGESALFAATTQFASTAVGASALNLATSGQQSVAVGQNSLPFLTTGSFHVSLGSTTGSSYTSSEASNILIGYNIPGTALESNVLRIGNATGTSSGNLNSAFIQGITGNTQALSGSVSVVTINNSSGLLGVVAATASGFIQTITGNSGGAQSPSVGNFNIVGTGSITTIGTANTETISLTGLTNHSLLVGAGTATITNLGVATNGQLPIGSTGANPVLAAITQGTNITITNGAGSITLDVATAAGLSLAAFGSSPNANGLTLSAGVLNMQPADGSNPGGVSTTTQNFAGNKVFNTSATSAAFLVASGGGGLATVQYPASAASFNFNLPTTAGTSGFFLTSAGGGSSNMTWTDPATVAGVLTITGNSGGAQSPSAGNFNLLGGTTGLTFAGTANTETLTGTLAIANGGTNATSFTQSNGIVAYNGTSLVNYAGPQLSSGGIYTNATQPSFYAYLSAQDDDATGDGTVFTVGSGNVYTIVSNRGTNFVNTGTFTAPVTGLYAMFAQIYFAGGSAAVAQTTIRIVTTGATFQQDQNLVWNGTSSVISLSALCPMTSGDTAVLRCSANGTTKTVDIFSGTGNTWFGGSLLC